MIILSTKTRLTLHQPCHPNPHMTTYEDASSGNFLDNESLGWACMVRAEVMIDKPFRDKSFFASALITYIPPYVIMGENIQFSIENDITAVLFK